MITIYDGENDYEALLEKYQELEAKYTALLKDYEELKNAKSKAGRRPNDEKWTAKYQAFARLKEKGLKREEIQQELNMSRATFFRYNKIYSGIGVEAEPVAESVEMPEAEYVAAPVVESEEMPLSVSVVVAAPVSAEEVSEIISEPETVSVSPIGTQTVIETSAESAKEKPAISVTESPSQEVKEQENHEGLVLDPATGEYVTPEGLRRRKKLAEIRARRAAEEKAAEEKAAEEKAAEEKAAEERAAEEQKNG